MSIVQDYIASGVVRPVIEGVMGVEDLTMETWSVGQEALCAQDAQNWFTRTMDKLKNEYITAYSCGPMFYCSTTAWPGMQALYLVVKKVNVGGTKCLVIKRLSESEFQEQTKHLEPMN